MYGQYQFPRIQRRNARSRVGTSGPSGGNQLAGAIPSGGMSGGGGGRPVPRGINRTTTGPTPEEQQANTPLGGLLAAKEAYDQTEKAYQGGQNITKAVSGFQPRMITDKLSVLNPLNKGIAASTPTQMVNSGMSAVQVPGPAIQHAGMLADVGKGSPYVGGVTEGIGQSGTQLSNATTKGAEAAANSSGKMLGAAGAGIGLGLSAYDMSQNGLNFGNVTGALGSGIAGYGMLTAGAVPGIGWALLAASAADSIFDIF